MHNHAKTFFLPVGPPRSKALGSFGVRPFGRVGDPPVLQFSLKHVRKTVGQDGEWTGGFGGYGNVAVWGADGAGDGHLPKGATHFAQGPTAMNVEVQVLDALAHLTMPITFDQYKLSIAEGINSTGGNLWALKEKWSSFEKKKISIECGWSFLY